MIEGLEMTSMEIIARKEGRTSEETAKGMTAEIKEETTNMIRIDPKETIPEIAHLVLNTTTLKIWSDTPDNQTDTSKTKTDMTSIGWIEEKDMIVTETTTLLARNNSTERRISSLLRPSLPTPILSMINVAVPAANKSRLVPKPTERRIDD